MEQECSTVVSEPRNTTKGSLSLWKQDLIDKEEKKKVVGTPEFTMEQLERQSMRDILQIRLNRIGINGYGVH